MGLSTFDFSRCLNFDYIKSIARSLWRKYRIEQRQDIIISSVTGKLCLQHEDLAKKSIPALVRELEVCDDVAVRNNVVIVMCDLCIRYTVMVDKYIPNISMCLKDSDPFIRKQTLILLTNLLQVCMSFFSSQHCF